MNNYEAMFIVNPNLNQDQQKELFAQLNDTVTKYKGEISDSKLWSEKRKLTYPIKKFHEGIYYLISFKVQPKEIVELRQAYRLNENIIRLLITNNN